MPNPLLTQISNTIPKPLHHFIRAWQCGIEIDAEFKNIWRFHEANNYALRVASIYHMLFHHEETHSKLLDEVKANFNSYKHPTLVRFALKCRMLNKDAFIENYLELIEQQQVPGIRQKLADFMDDKINLNDFLTDNDESPHYWPFSEDFLRHLEMTLEQAQRSDNVSTLIRVYGTETGEIKESTKRGLYQEWIKFRRDDDHDHSFETFYEESLNVSIGKLGKGLSDLSTLGSDEERVAHLLANPKIVFDYYQSESGAGEGRSIQDELKDKEWANEPMLGTAAAMLGYQLTILDIVSGKTMKPSEDNEAPHIYLDKRPLAWDPNPDMYAKKYRYIKHDGNCGYDSFLSAIKADYDNLSQEDKNLLLKHKQTYFKPFSIENETYAPIRRFLCCPTPFFSHCGQSSMFAPVRVIGYPVIITASALILGHFGLAALSSFMLINPAATVALIVLCTATSIGLVEGVNQLYMSPQV